MTGQNACDPASWGALLRGAKVGQGSLDGGLASQEESLFCKKKICTFGPGPALGGLIDLARRAAANPDPPEPQAPYRILRSLRLLRGVYALSRRSARGSLVQADVGWAAASEAGSGLITRSSSGAGVGRRHIRAVNGDPPAGSSSRHFRLPEAKSSSVAVASTVPSPATISNSFPSTASHRKSTVEPSAPPYSIWISPAGACP